MSFRRFAMTIAMLGLSAVGAVAQSCEDLPGAAALPGNGAGFLSVQQTLAASLGIETPLLSDGRRGPVSDAALIRLCTEFPGSENGDAVSDGLALLDELSALRAFVPDWRARLLAPDTVARILGEDGARVVLALAGPPAIKGAALMGASAISAEQCAAMPDLNAGADAGLEALEVAGFLPLGPGDRLQRYCRATPILGSSDALVAALVRHDEIEARFPGAVSVLGSPVFAQWLSADAERRLPRLMGTPATIERLLRDFQVAAPARPAGMTVAQSSLEICRADTDALQYWSFGAQEFSRLSMANDVRVALESLEGPMPGPEALIAALAEALGADMSPCLRARISDIVNGAQSPARLYWLDEAGVQQLGLEGDLADRQGVIEGLIGRSASSRAALLNGVQGALERATRLALEADITQAVALIADAAEIMPVFFDRPAPGLPEPEVLPQSQTLIVTALTRETAQAALRNDALLRAFFEADFAPRQNRTLLEADLRQVFAPAAEVEIEQIVARDMARIENLVRVRWAITPDLIEAVFALPELTPFGATQAELAQSRLGLEYPTANLMRQAFAVLHPALPEALQEAALAVSTKTIEDPNQRRMSDGIAAVGCGCVMRREEHALVYGFYPFWLLPPEPAPGAQDEAPPPAYNRVNFELVERIAFYGLQWAAGQEAGVLELRYNQQWLRHRRDFVTSAQQHRAKADLSIRLTGWEDWDESQIEAVVAGTDRMMQPFDRYDAFTVIEARRFLPTLFERPQPDGLTLIIDGYQGGQDHPQAERLVALVSRIAQPLALRGQTVNLGLELKLDRLANAEGLFGDLAPLVERNRDRRSTVDQMLIFLEQPVAQMARVIRQKLDGGTYRADVRTDILRRIVPVVAPAGDRFVGKNDLTDMQDLQSPSTQFLDKLIYFQDNFAGIGFWPVPLADDPGDVALSWIVFDNWDAWNLPVELAVVEERFDAVCAFVCPNRFYLSATAGAIAVSVGLLIIWSFYSGTGERIAYRWHAVAIGNLSVFSLLVLLSACDQGAILARIFLLLLSLVLVLALLFNTYQFARNGPKP